MNGIEFIDLALMPALLVALLAGIVSFLSPCVLPIVPPYLAYMGGVSVQSLSQEKGAARKAALIAALFFVLGLSTVFVFLGIAASEIGRVLLQNQVLFGQIAGGVIILFGLHFVGLIRLPFLYREARIDLKDRGGSAFGAYLLGLAFAFGWTPCIGPILSAILSIAAQEQQASKGAMLMLAYALGLGMPFLLAAWFLEDAMRMMGHVKPHMRKIEIAMGVLLAIIGVAMITGAFSAFSYWLLELFPKLGAIG